MPVVSKGEFTVSRLDDGVSSYLHTAWKMADGTFSSEYPQENLLSDTLPNKWPTLENKRAVGSSISKINDAGNILVTATGGTPYYFAGNYSATQVLSDDFLNRIRGKRLVASANVTFVNQLTVPTDSLGISIYCWDDTGRAWQPENRKSMAGSEIISIDVLIPENIVNILVAVRGYGSFVSGASYEIKKMKLEIVEQGSTPTIYTPAPSEDYTLAYPKWRGEYTDFTAADSTNPDDYTWTAYLGQSGQDGNNGADGVGIASTAVTYQASSNGTTAPTGTWSTTIPSVAANQYLWTRTVISYTNNTSSTAYSVGKMGANGATGPAGTPGKDGSNGANGVSVTSVVEEYYISTSPTSQAGGSWSTTVPNNADPNKYIWRRMKNTFSDGTVTYTNPALIQGMTGIYPYIGPTQPANPKEGQQWWKSDSSGNVTNFYVYKNGSWQGQTIQQSILNIVALNAVTITGSTITGTNINGSVFTNTFTIDLGVSDTGTGTTVIRDGAIKMDMAVKDSAGTASYTQGQELSMQNGLYMWQKLEGQSAANQSYARLTPAGLDLQSIAGGAVRNTTLSIDSIYSLVRPASRNIKPADDANRANVSLNYYRVGNLVSLGIKFDLLKDTGWVALAPVPPTGYTPYSGTQATTVAGSLSYRGQSCLVYYNAQGFRLIPTTGQGTGTFQAGITYVTEDPFPYGDS